MRWLLIALAFLLAAIVAAEWFYFSSRAGTWLPDPEPPPALEDPKPILTVADDFQLPALVSFEIIEERPLFVEGRRPPSEEAEEAAEEEVVISLEPPALTLLGVMITPEGRLALVRKHKPPEIKRLREGDLVDGWTLTEIGTGRILVTQGEQQEAFPLREYKYPADPAPAQARAPRRNPQQRPKPNPRAFAPTFGGAGKPKN